MTAVLALLGAGQTERHEIGLSPRAASAAAAALGVDGISVGVGTGPEGIVLTWGREKVAVALEDAQFTLGQGPGHDAVTSGTPVLEPDLALAGAVGRYPAFTPAATNLRVRAVFAFPLRIGAISVGMLTAHRAAPGPLTIAQLADALALADAVTVLLLHQDPPHSEADGASRAVPRNGSTQPATHRAQVHQATGMISVQLGVSLAEALVRLRARAYADDRLINDLADDVVARRMRFDPSDP
jgi:hypothetical protein